MSDLPFTCYHHLPHMCHYWLIPQQALYDLTVMMRQEVAAVLETGLCLWSLTGRGARSLV